MAQRLPLWRSPGLLLALVFALLFLVRLDQPVMQRQQELRVALAARSIVESGNWLVPQFQQTLRVRKPPLMTWCDASAFILTGRSDSAAVARSLSAMAALMMLALLYRWVKREQDEETAWWSVAALGTSFLFIRHARSAETDMLLGLWIVIALRQVYTLVHDRAGPKAWLILGAAMGLGFMTKGPAAVALPLVTLAVCWKTISVPRKGVGLLSALVLTVLVAAPWYIYINQFLSQSPEATEALRKELTATFVKTAHPGNLLYYVYTVPWMMLPAGLVLPWGLKRMFGKALPALPAFIRTWFLAGFILLTLTPSKQAHYALLLLVPAGLLCGPVLRDMAQRLPGLGRLVLVLAPLCLHAYLQWGSPRFNPYQHAPEFIAPWREAMHQAKHVHVVGINSAVVDFYGGLHVHAADDLDYALRRAYSGDVIIGIGEEEKLNGGRALPEGAEQLERHGSATYVVYTRKPPKAAPSSPDESAGKDRRAPLGN